MTNIGASGSLPINGSADRMIDEEIIAAVCLYADAMMVVQLLPVLFHSRVHLDVSPCNSNPSKIGICRREQFCMHPQSCGNNSNVRSVNVLAHISLRLDSARNLRKFNLNKSHIETTLQRPPHPNTCPQYLIESDRQQWQHPLPPTIGILIRIVGGKTSGQRVWMGSRSYKISGFHASQLLRILFSRYGYIIVLLLLTSDVKVIGFMSRGANSLSRRRGLESLEKECEIACVNVTPSIILIPKPLGHSRN